MFERRTKRYQSRFRRVKEKCNVLGTNDSFDRWISGRSKVFISGRNHCPCSLWFRVPVTSIIGDIIGDKISILQSIISRSCKEYLLENKYPSSSFTI